MQDMMKVENEFSRIPRPPITEAVIEFRVSTNEICSEQKLSELSNQLRESFPKRQGRTEVAFELKFPAGGLPKKLEGEVLKREESFGGFLLFSEDRRNRVQIKPRSISVHRVRPYESWEQLKGLFDEVWPKYTAVVAPLTVNRIGVRFINKLTLPSTGVLSDYYLSLPPKPPHWPSEISSYAARQILHEGEATAAINQKISFSTGKGELEVLLDIDASIACQYAPDASEISEAMSSLRHLKNRIFFGAFTRKTMEHLEHTP